MNEKKSVICCFCLIYQIQVHILLLGLGVCLNQIKQTIRSSVKKSWQGHVKTTKASKLLTSARNGSEQIYRLFSKWCGEMNLLLSTKLWDRRFQRNKTVHPTRRDNRDKSFVNFNVGDIHGSWKGRGLETRLWCLNLLFCTEWVIYLKIILGSRVTYTLENK